MLQRRKEDDAWVWSIGRLVALLLAMALFYPPFRQDIPTPGLIFLGMLSVLLVGGGLLSLVRSVVPTPPQTLSANPLQSSFWTPTQSSSYLPQSTYELLRQLREGDAALAQSILTLVYQKLQYRVTRGADGTLTIERNGACRGLEYIVANQTKVGVKIVRQFREKLTKARLEKGILIASEGFTSHARKLAQTCGIELMDETDLGRVLDSTHAGHDTTILGALPNSRKALAGRTNSLPALSTAESP